MEVASVRQSTPVKFQTFFMIAGKIAALLVTFALPLVLTRVLSKSEYGIFAQFYVVVFFCTGVFNLSVQSNLYYYYPTADDQTRRSLVFQTLLFLILVAILAAGLISFPVIGKLLIGEGDLILYKYYILLGIILLMPVYILDPLYVVKKDIYTSLVYPPAEVLLRLSLVIGLFVLKPGLDSIFSGIVISATACLVFVLIYTVKEIGIKNINRRIFNMELVGKQMHYSVPFGVASSMNILFQRFDKIICITFLTPAEFAVYAIAFYGIPGMMQVFDTLAQVYIVQMTVKYQDNKTNELSELYKTLVTKIYSFSLPALLIVMLYAKKIIALLFTSNYLDAVPLFRAYLLSIPVFMLSGGIILRAMGKTTYNLRSYLIAGVFILPLTYFLIKYVGIWGAMIGALISIALPKFLNLAAEIKLLKLRFTNFFPWKNFATITLISLISVIPFLALEYWFDYGIIVSALLGILYIIIVSMLELKYDLFPMASDSVKNKLRPYLGLIRLYSPENRK